MNPLSVLVDCLKSLFIYTEFCLSLIWEMIISFSYYICSISSKTLFISPLHSLLCPALSFTCRIIQCKVIHRLVNTWEEITSGWKTERIKKLMRLYMVHSVVVSIIVSGSNEPHYRLKTALFRAAVNACYFFHCGFFKSLISGFLMSILLSVVQWLISIPCFSNVRFLHVPAFDLLYLVILSVLSWFSRIR